MTHSEDLTTQRLARRLEGCLKAIAEEGLGIWVQAGDSIMLMNQEAYKAIRDDDILYVEHIGVRDHGALLGAGDQTWGLYEG